MALPASLIPLFNNQTVLDRLLLVHQEVNIPFTKRDRPLSEYVGQYFVLSLGGLLRVLGYGDVDFLASGGRHLGGGTINGKDIKTWEQYSVSLCCNPSRGLALIMETLWWLRAPLATKFNPSRDRSEAFTLADNRDIIAPGESYLGIYVPTVDPKWHWHVAHTLSDSLNDVLASPGVLGDGGRLSGPTKDG
jgi:hypothetical protein